MQFHPTGTDPTSSALLVCRNTRWNVPVLLAVLWAAPIFWWWVAAPWWVVLLCAALPAMLTWPLLGTWRKRGRGDNWVMAVQPDGLWLNLRDCEYHEAEPGHSVVFLPHAKVAAARRVIHRYTTPSGTGRTVIDAGPSAGELWYTGAGRTRELRLCRARLTPGISKSSMKMWRACSVKRPRPSGLR